MILIKFLKFILYPLRFLITKLILKDKIINSYKQNSPINMAASYIITEGIKGNYLEFGTFKGASFIAAYKAITYYEEKWSNFDRTNQAFTNHNLAKQSFEKLEINNANYFVFDSFKGLPEPENVDKNHPIFSKGRYDFSKYNFINNLKKNGIDLKKVKIIEGFYDQTLNAYQKNKLNIGKAAIVMIDCDLYNSTKLVLEFITDLVQDGTILIFDDWFAYKASKNRGEQKATNEWLEKNKHITLIPFSRYGIYQYSFIVSINQNV